MACMFNITLTDKEFDVKLVVEHYNDRMCMCEMYVDDEMTGRIGITPTQARQLAWWLNQWASDNGGGVDYGIPDEAPTPTISA